jgi:heme/copper-type cytochrome/quinol oxidase subunit 2
MNRRMILSLSSFGLLAMAWLWLPLPHTTELTTHNLEINAAEYAYTPGRIHVNHGDQVVISLTSTDVVHGFYLDGYGINERVTPGIEQRITFTADRTGKFRYRCSVSCGSLHPFMVGELVVSPNQPFVKSAGVVLIALAGMVSYIWQSGRSFHHE